MSSPQTQTTSDLQAVADAIRSHDRFLLVTHENPDGDALGSLLATKLALDAARQGQRDVPLRRRAAAAGVRLHGARAASRASRRTTPPSACWSRSTARTRRASAPDPTLLEHAPLTLDIDHHHDNSRFGDVNLVVGDASSTGEVLRDLFAELGVELTPEIAEALYIAVVTDTGRFQYTNTTPKALRLAAELVDAGADVHRVFQAVYESVEFAKLKLLGRALDRAQVYEGGRLVVSYLLRSDFTELNVAEAFSEGIIDYLRAVEGAEMAALIREPPRARRAAAADQPARLERRARRLRDRAQVRRAAATGRPRGSRATPRSRRSPSSSTASSVPPRALDPSGLVLIDKPAGPSSFTVVARRAPADRRAHRPRRHARPVRDRPLARALGLGDQAGPALRRAGQALPDRRRPDGRDRHRRPRRHCASSTTIRRDDARAAAAKRCAARSSCRSRPPRR